MTQERNDERWEMRCDVRRSVRYHDRRAAHFERLGRVTNVLTILLAGVVLMEVVSSGAPLWIRILAAIGAILSSVDLVIGFGKCAGLHRELKRRFIELEKLIDAGSSLTDARAQRLGIEADEPLPYRALDLLCHDEIAAAVGHNRRDHPDEFSSLPWYMRWSANWLRWDNVGRSHASGTHPR